MLQQQRSVRVNQRQHVKFKRGFLETAFFKPGNDGTRRNFNSSFTLVLSSKLRTIFCYCCNLLINNLLLICLDKNLTFYKSAISRNFDFKLKYTYFSSNGFVNYDLVWIWHFLLKCQKKKRKKIFKLNTCFKKPERRNSYFFFLTPRINCQCLFQYFLYICKLHEHKIFGLRTKLALPYLLLICFIFFASLFYFLLHFAYSCVGTAVFAECLIYVK